MKKAKPVAAQLPEPRITRNASGLCRSKAKAACGRKRRKAAARVWREGGRRGGESVMSMPPFCLQRAREASRRLEWCKGVGVMG